jgi:hypothetical protein
MLVNKFEYNIKVNVYLFNIKNFYLSNLTIIIIINFIN